MKSPDNFWLPIAVVLGLLLGWIISATLDAPRPAPLVTFGGSP